jgi:hypothetical protein
MTAPDRVFVDVDSHGIPTAVWRSGDVADCTEYIRADPAVILAAALELPKVKALIRAAQDAEYDLHEWVQCAEWLEKAGFDMDGTPEVLNALSRALAAFSAAALKPDAKG